MAGQAQEVHPRRSERQKLACAAARMHVHAFASAVSLCTHPCQKLLMPAHLWTDRGSFNVGLRPTFQHCHCSQLSGIAFCSHASFVSMSGAISSNILKSGVCYSSLSSLENAAQNISGAANVYPVFSKSAFQENMISYAPFTCSQKHLAQVSLN